MERNIEKTVKNIISISHEIYLQQVKKLTFSVLVDERNYLSNIKSLRRS